MRQHKVASPALSAAAWAGLIEAAMVGEGVDAGLGVAREATEDLGSREHAPAAVLGAIAGSCARADSFFPAMAAHAAALEARTVLPPEAYAALTDVALRMGLSETVRQLMDTVMWAGVERTPQIWGARAYYCIKLGQYRDALLTLGAMRHKAIPAPQALLRDMVTMVRARRCRMLHFVTDTQPALFSQACDRDDPVQAMRLLRFYRKSLGSSAAAARDAHHTELVRRILASCSEEEENHASVFVAAYARIGVAAAAADGNVHRASAEVRSACERMLPLLWRMVPLQGSTYAKRVASVQLAIDAPARWEVSARADYLRKVAVDKSDSALLDGDLEVPEFGKL